MTGIAVNEADLRALANGRLAQEFDYLAADEKPDFEAFLGWWSNTTAAAT